MRTLFGLTVLALIVACGTPKASRDRYKDLHVIYGSGGGFTGAVEQYEIDSRNALYRISIPGDTTYLKTISRSQRKELKRLIQSDTFYRLSYNLGANMSSFLYIRSKAGLLQSFQWNISDKQLPKPLFQLDSFLKTLNN